MADSFNITDAVTWPNISDAVAWPNTTDSVTWPNITDSVTWPNLTDSVTWPNITDAVAWPNITDAVTWQNITDSVTWPNITDADTWPNETCLALRRQGFELNFSSSGAVQDCVCGHQEISPEEYQAWGCTFYEPETEPAFEATVWTSYILIMLLSIVGNSLVCYVVLSSTRLRTVTNYLLVNMAAGDLLMTVLCVPFTFPAVMLLRRWPFGAAMCSVVSFTQAVSVFVSAFSLIAVSLDRHRAIVYPLRPRATRRHARLVIAAIWVLSAAACVPIAVTSRTLTPPTRRYTLAGLQVCQEVWRSEGRQLYSWAVMTLQYFAPVLVLVYTYGRIAVQVWGRRSSGLFEQRDPREARLVRTRRKVVVMMVVCVAAYTFAWLPYHVFELAAHHYPSVLDWRHVRVLFWAVHAVAMSHCCMNPVIYFSMNDRFREQLASRCCPGAARRRDGSRYTQECVNLPQTNGTSRTSCLNSVKYETSRL